MISRKFAKVEKDGNKVGSNNKWESNKKSPYAKVNGMRTSLYIVIRHSGTSMVDDAGHDPATN